MRENDFPSHKTTKLINLSHQTIDRKTMTSDSDSDSDSDSVFVDIQKLGSDNYNKPTSMLSSLDEWLNKPTSMLSSLDEWLWVNPNNALDRPIVHNYSRFWATFSIVSAVFFLYLVYRIEST